LVYEILYKSSVKKDLKNINKEDAKRILDEIECTLSQNPWKGVPLSGKYKGLYKYRIGKYRVIYVVEGTQILVLKIAHRKQVYR